MGTVWSQARKHDEKLAASYRTRNMLAVEELWPRIFLVLACTITYLRRRPDGQAMISHVSAFSIYAHLVFLVYTSAVIGEHMLRLPKCWLTGLQAPSLNATDLLYVQKLTSSSVDADDAELHVVAERWTC